MTETTQNSIGLFRYVLQFTVSLLRMLKHYCFCKFDGILSNTGGGVI